MYWGTTMKLPHPSLRRATTDAGCRWSSPRRPFWWSPARGMRTRIRFVPPPPPKVEVAAPVQRTVTRYLEATGNTAPIKNRRSGRARAGLPAIDQLSGRHLRQGGHHAVHDRARDLQAEARAGAGGRSRRAGLAQAGRGRFQAAGRSGAAAGGLAGDARYLDLHARQRAGQSAAGPGQHQDRRGQLRLHQGRPRRSTASSARIWSRSANSSASPRRPSSRPSWRSIRSM